MALPIIVYGNGEVFQACFTAIANIFGGSVFLVVFKIALLLAGITAIFSAITRRDFLQCLRWFGRYYLVYYLLFAPQIDVTISDQISEQKFVVQAVPLGLAIFASYVTSINGALLKLLEDNLGRDFAPLQFSRGGMMAASQVVNAVSQLHATNLGFASNLREFVQHCSKVTTDELLTTNNLWGIITDPGRVKFGTFTYNGEIIACANGVDRLTADFVLLLEQSKLKYGRILFPEVSPETAMAKLEAAISLSYKYLLNLNNSADQIIQQNIVINELQERLKVQSWSRASFSYRLVNLLPLIKNVSEIAIYMSFMLVVLLALFPFGLTILKNYVLILLWLQTWPLLDVVVNYMCTNYARSQMPCHELMPQYLLNIMQVNSDAISIAGYLALGLPLLIVGLVRGITIALTHTAVEHKLVRSNFHDGPSPHGLSANVGRQGFSPNSSTVDKVNG